MFRVKACIEFCPLYDDCRFACYASSKLKLSFESINSFSTPHQGIHLLNTQLTVLGLPFPSSRQVEWRPVSLEELVPDDHHVRAVWRFVEDLDLSALLSPIKSLEGRPGQPAAGAS